MAVYDLDTWGDRYINLSNPTGATGTWDDLMVVQALLMLYWKGSKTAQKIVPSEPDVDGAAHKETVLLIKQFQREIMKRPHPQGFINPVADRAKSRSSTIWQLNAHASMAIAALGLGSQEAVDWVPANYGRLQDSLGKPRGERSPVEEQAR